VNVWHALRIANFAMADVFIRIMVPVQENVSVEIVLLKSEK